MLINLSNHRLEHWSITQLESAKENYGSIFDLEFPHLDPADNLPKIEIQVEEYANQCEKILNDAKSKFEDAIHIMGEMTFVYQFVKKMTAKGILCVASTTERKVEERKNDVKISTFNFIQFRPYEDIK